MAQRTITEAQSFGNSPPEHLMTEQHPGFQGLDHNPLPHGPLLVAGISGPTLTLCLLHAASWAE